MTQFFILPEDADADAVNEFLEEFDKFLNKILSEWNNDLGRVNKIDEKFIREYAEGFNDLREIGVVGLVTKYVGRYYISSYEDIPFWVSEAIKDVTHSYQIVMRDEKESDW